MTEEVRRPGRPRDAGTERVILDAAVAILGEVGFAGLTVDAVAARAGVGKATIYRRWPSKEALLMAVAALTAESQVVPDTGSLREDLIGLLRHLAEMSADPIKRCVMPAMMAEAQRNDEVRRLVTKFANERRNGGRRIIRRAMARGELPPNVDVELLLDLLAAPVFYRLIVLGESTRPQRVAQIVDHVLRSAGAETHERRRPGRV
ncbi:MAG: TetR/AcrR family transcriptional regulator [Acidimicrobiales bacterium]